MKGIIVVNAYVKNKSQINQAQRIKDELCGFGVECDIVKNICLAEISGGSVVAGDYDFCVFLDKDRVAARLLEKKGIRLFNCAQAIENCDDKMLTHIVLADNGILMPDSMYAPLCYYPDAPSPVAFLNDVAKKLGFPLVAKSCFGSLGKGVCLINNYSELVEYEEKKKLSAHFYQRLTGKRGEDVRVIVIGGKFVCSMLRSNPNDFRSNVGLGGKGTKYVADEELIKLCEKVANILNLDYCGIDVLTDSEGKRYICEVNSNAFFEEAERACGVNIAKKYAETIIAIKNA